MTTCSGCGSWIDFRYVDGILRPLGCSCYSGGGETVTYEEATASRRRLRFLPHGVGKRVIRWRLTYQTICWWCGARVYYHTNGNGDCVLFDRLGHPWQVHGCWERYREERGRAVAAAGRLLASMGLVQNSSSGPLAREIAE
jgi:hypothetical protein